MGLVQLEWSAPLSPLKLEDPFFNVGDYNYGIPIVSYNEDIEFIVHVVLQLTLSNFMFRHLY